MSVISPSDRELIRNVILFHWKKKTKVTETTKVINEAFPNAITSRTVRKWYQRFNSGDHTLTDRKRSGRPKEVNQEQLKDLIEDNPRQTTYELATILNCNQSTVFRNLIAIGKRNLQGQWVPHCLTEAQQAARVRVCAELLQMYKTANFLDKIITGDEKWIVYNNVQRTKEWRSSGQSASQVAKPEVHQRKVLLSVWWSKRGIEHYEVLPNGQTITSEIYRQQLDRLLVKLRKNRPELINRKGVLLQHDNARPHVAKSTVKHINDFAWSVLPHPPYSPDLAPSDYALFRSLQHHLAGKTFTSSEDIENVLEQFFDSKPRSFYEKAIDGLPKRWQLVVDHCGSYFDDNNLV